MPKKVIPLSDSVCRSAKPVPGKSLKLFDGEGLYLEVTSHGTKLWRMKYRFEGKEKLLALGSYPNVALSEARTAKIEARRLLSQQIDPSLKKQTDRHLSEVAARDTLEITARDWHAKKAKDWAVNHASKVLLRLEKNIFPWLGSRPLSSIKAHEIKTALKRVESRGALDTAGRILQYLDMIFRYAIGEGRAERNVAADLVGTLETPIRKKYASIYDPVEIGKLLCTIHEFECPFTTKTALKLAPLLFCRPGELRGMKWSELDLESATWTLPPDRQKIKTKVKRSGTRPDIVFPLARQSVELLAEVKPLTGAGIYVFPSERTWQRSMSDGTINAALRRMGIQKHQLTGHGFRHMASTILNDEHRWHKDVIERQLSHVDKDPIRGTYCNVLVF